MDVCRDLLDKQVVDRNGRWLGRVDGIVLEHTDGGPPRLAAILIGPVALAFRLHPAIGRWMAAFERICELPKGRPVRIGLEHIVDIGRYVKTDLSSSETDALAVEHKLRRWVARIPGGG